MIKVQDVINTNYRVPDLDRMEKFLTDFGMVRARRAETPSKTRSPVGGEPLEPRHGAGRTRPGELVLAGDGHLEEDFVANVDLFVEQLAQLQTVFMLQKNSLMSSLKN